MPGRGRGSGTVADGTGGVTAAFLWDAAMPGAECPDAGAVDKAVIARMIADAAARRLRVMALSI
jgi:hypothetical protein